MTEVKMTYETTKIEIFSSWNILPHKSHNFKEKNTNKFLPKERGAYF